MITERDSSPDGPSPGPTNPPDGDGTRGLLGTNSLVIFSPIFGTDLHHGWIIHSSGQRKDAL